MLLLLALLLLLLTLTPVLVLGGMRVHCTDPAHGEARTGEGEQDAQEEGLDPRPRQTRHDDGDDDDVLLLFLPCQVLSTWLDGRATLWLACTGKQAGSA